MLSLFRLPSAVLCLILAMSLQGVSATSERSQCLHARSKELSEATACGHEHFLQYRFSTAPDFVSSTDVERYLMDAGCADKEAAIETAWIFQLCEGLETETELRRRLSHVQQRKGPAQIAARQTTTAAAATTTDANPSIIVIIGTATTVLPCSTTTTVSTSSCPVVMTGVSSGHTLSCIPTETAVLRCAPGMLCQTTSSGDNICKVRVDTLDTGMAIFSILFAVVLVVMVVTLCAMCCRDRRRQKALRRKAEAATLLKRSATVAGAGPSRPRASSAVRKADGAAAVIAQEQEMHEMYPPQQQQQQQQQQYDTGYAGHAGTGHVAEEHDAYEYRRDPFADGQRMD